MERNVHHREPCCASPSPCLAFDPSWPLGPLSLSYLFMLLKEIQAQRDPTSTVMPNTPFDVLCYRSIEQRQDLEVQRRFAFSARLNQFSVRLPLPRILLAFALGSLSSERMRMATRLLPAPAGQYSRRSKRASPFARERRTTTCICGTALVDGHAAPRR